MMNKLQTKVGELSEVVGKAYENISWKFAAPLLASPIFAEYANTYVSNKMHGTHETSFSTAGDFVQLAISEAIIAGVGLYGAYNDLKNKQKHEKLLASKQKYKTLFEETNGGIYQTSSTGELLLANPALAQMLGYDSIEDLKEKLLSVANTYADPDARKNFLSILNEKGSVHGLELHLQRKDGSKIWVSESARVVRDATGNVLFYEGIMQDITVRKELEKQLKEFGDRDSLTGLYSRGFYNRNIEEIVSSCQANNQNLGIIQMDLDNFKPLNDTWGHDRGDKVLATFGHQFSSELKECDYAIRFGGDEFLILLPGADMRTRKKVIDRIRQKLQLYNRFNNRDIKYNIEFSAGFALREPNATEDIDFFIKQSDLGMYADKAKRKSKIKLKTQ